MKKFLIVLNRLLAALQLCYFAFIAFAPFSSAKAAEDDEQRFFDKKILPLLESRCFECHSHGKKIEGGLTLDSKSGWRKGGESGPTIFPGKPDESLLIKAIRYNDVTLQMPPKAKLSPAEISLLETWVNRGAFDPRETTDPPESPTKLTGIDLKEGKKWWAFQPVRKIAPPVMKVLDTSADPIDRFLAARLEAEKLTPAADADRPVLIRRLKFALLGLPPTPDEVKAFVADKDPLAYEKLVAQYLGSPHFGERWARHWMDLVRYSETHGSEFDSLYPFAWNYRDYLIRAFNDDVPYNQFVREQIAGDLLTKPRWNPTLGINESLIGTASQRFIEFYHSPVDPKREEVGIIESQIDALGKTYQALTIACARCHDHKFDPITNDDFYSLYGIFNSSRPVMNVLENAERFTRHNAELADLKKQIVPKLADHWRKSLSTWPEKIADAAQWLHEHPTPPMAEKKKLEELLPTEPWRRTFARAAWDKSPTPFTPLLSLMKVSESDRSTFSKQWSEINKQQAATPSFPSDAKVFADFRRGDLNGWKFRGVGQIAQPQPGGFGIAAKGDRFLDALRPAGLYTDTLSDRHYGVLSSPPFIVEAGQISVLASGHGAARLRLVVENFQSDTVLFGSVNPDLNDPQTRWISLPIRSAWIGMRAHLELMTRDEKTYNNRHRLPENFATTDGRSAWGVTQVIFRHSGALLNSGASLPPYFWEATPGSWSEVPSQLIDLTDTCITAWQGGTCTDVQVHWLNALIVEGILGTSLNESPELNALALRYREVEQQIPIATRAPGLSDDSFGTDTRFMPRGNHLRLGAPVPRRFLSVLDSNAADYASGASGRSRLAEEIVSPTNPLTARSIVNRVWHWLFGQGLVASVDNFGKLGELPSHPELLDYLAAEFMDDGWSVKRLIRRLVLTRAWQRSSEPSPLSLQIDPENRLLQHFSVRRLEAEEIRDAMLAVAGNLKPDLYGVPVRVHYKMELDADKQPKPGPIDGNGRRSIYLETRRNFPSEFLQAFDQAKAMSTTGRRSVTNVPAQSLALLNDPQVLYEADLWARRILTRDVGDEERVAQMVYEAFGHPASTNEIKRLLTLLPDDAAERRLPKAWQRIAHALLNFKEFIYLR